MQVKKITIQNFKAATFLEVDFPYQKNIIKAANGVGKTTIMDAYFWCFTGKLSNNMSKGFQPRLKESNTHRQKGELDLAKETSVEVEVIIDGATVIFGRGYRNSATNNAAITSLWYVVNGFRQTFKTNDEFYKSIKGHYNIDRENFLFFSNPESSWSKTLEKDDVKTNFFKLVQPLVQEELNKLQLPDDFLETSNIQDIHNIIETLRLEELEIQKNILTTETKLAAEVGVVDPANHKKVLETLEKELLEKQSILKINNDKILGWRNEKNELTAKYNNEIKTREDLVNTTKILLNELNDIKAQSTVIENKISNIREDSINFYNNVKNNSLLDAQNNQKERIRQLELQNEKNKNGCYACGQPIPMIDISKEIEILNNLPNSFSNKDFTTEIETRIVNETTNCKNQLNSLWESFQSKKSIYEEKVNFLKTIVINPITPQIDNLNLFINNVELSLQTNQEDIQSLQNKISEHKHCIKLFDSKLIAQEELKALKIQQEKLCNNIEILKKYLERSIEIITSFINDRLTSCRIKLFEYTKTTNTLKSIFTISENTNHATENEMNNGAKIRSSIEITSLLQKLSGRNFPIWIDEASRLDDLIFNISPDNQLIVLEVERKFNKTEVLKTIKELQNLSFDNEVVKNSVFKTIQELETSLQSIEESKNEVENKIQILELS
ncbi:MAG: AAA family ATPase [Mycoplasma sp.]